eukprot:TRINITY_DN686_c0_g1::TRINITY_DN686_c0_g1_i1::g.28928::m.28928 TRINITY_DN686_c0_g1::TRINITY_DN686_c0_g1_i1::g.28928  ORF type:complete len:374 (-),score=47.19,sp/Q9SL76/P2C19_ARATH/39.37/2e-60,PP2C/PF00481.16/1.8e-46,PP2C_2/PF13672.1/2.7e-05 TRINITY_DN686_c0_g1_i1:228-1307(-)
METPDPQRTVEEQRKRLSALTVDENDGGASSPKSPVFKASADTTRQRRRLSLVAMDAKDEDSPATLSPLSVKSSKGKLPLLLASKSKCGFEPYKGGKENQDDYCEIESFGNDQNQAFFAVFDGHGWFGKEVSNFVKKTLPEDILKQENLQTNPKDALMKAHIEAEKKLISSRIDISCSGSTAVSCLLQGNKIYTSNLGDSRAVLGQKGKDGKLVAVPLSIDHKPDVPAERKRIENSNGRVQPWGGGNEGPYRVWLKTQDVPGLAMSRSFGDAVATSVGCISEPEVTERTLGPDDILFIIASDGVWEFISNERAVEIAGECASPKDACEALVRESERLWREEENVVDDITVIVAFLFYEV